ncbi:hypothetical protein HMPREF1501_0677 [Fusobacterium sp. OBRC1]|nr:hypothetical protein HMPREF1501_0677 [Fusobacterium sp. OBRC1]
MYRKYIKAKIPKIFIVVFILVLSICLSLSIPINIRYRTAIKNDMIFKIRLIVIIFPLSINIINFHNMYREYIKAKIPKIAIIVFILVFSICLSLSISINIRHRTAINKDMIFKIRLTVIIFSFSS